MDPANKKPQDSNEPVADAVDNLKNIASDIKEDTKDLKDDVNNTAKDVAENMTDKIEVTNDAVSDKVEDVKEAVDDKISDAKEAVEGAGNSISDKISDAVDAIEGASDDINASKDVAKEEVAPIEGVTEKTEETITTPEEESVIEPKIQSESAPSGYIIAVNFEYNFNRLDYIIGLSVSRLHNCFLLCSIKSMTQEKRGDLIRLFFTSLEEKGFFY